MPNKPRNATIRIARAFYVYHPDFRVNQDGSYTVLPTGKWSVEWTIYYQDKVSIEHYCVYCRTEEKAKKLYDKIMQVHGEDTPWIRVSLKSKIFQGVKKIILSSFFSAV